MAKLKGTIKTEYIPRKSYADRPGDYERRVADAQRSAAAGRSTLSPEAQAQINVEVIRAEQKAREGKELSQAEYTILKQAGRVEGYKVEGQEVLKQPEYQFTQAPTRVQEAPAAAQVASSGLTLAGQKAQYAATVKASPLLAAVPSPEAPVKTEKQEKKYYKQVYLGGERIVSEDELEKYGMSPLGPYYQYVDETFFKPIGAGFELAEKATDLAKTKISEKSQTAKALIQASEFISPTNAGKAIRELAQSERPTETAFLLSTTRLLQTGTAMESDYVYDYTTGSFVKKKGAAARQVLETAEKTAEPVRSNVVSRESAKEVIRKSTTQQNVDRISSMVEQVRADPTKAEKAKETLKLFEEALGKEKTAALLKEYAAQEGANVYASISPTVKETVKKIPTTTKEVVEKISEDIVYMTPRMDFAGAIAVGLSKFKFKEKPIEEEKTTESISTELSQGLIVSQVPRTSEKTKVITAVKVATTPKVSTKTITTPTSAQISAPISTPISSPLISPISTAPTRVPARGGGIGFGFPIVPLTDTISPAGRFYSPRKPAKIGPGKKAPTATLIGVLTGKTQPAKELRGKKTGFEIRGIPIYPPKKGLKLIKKKKLSLLKVKGGQSLFRL